MPIYKYKCEDCGHIFEQFFFTIKKAEKELKCPECDGLSQKTFTTTSFATKKINIDKQFADDQKEYREMHYYEKKKDWKNAAKAAEGVSDFAKKKFEQKAKEEQ